MKLDPEIKLQILEKVGIYSNRFSIPEPKVLFTTKEVLENVYLCRKCTYFEGEHII